MSAERTGPLADFERPPLQEVALAVGFDELPGLRAIELGSLWRTWQQDYPTLDEQPPLPPDSGDGEVGFLVSFGAPPLGRQLFSAADGSRLLQLQADRLILNWRRSPDGGAYPRYPVLRAEVERRLADVQTLSQDRDGRPVAVRRVELTYVNLIAGAEGPPALAEVIVGVGEADVGWLGAPQEERLVRRWSPVGPYELTLSCLAAPGATPDGVSALVLTLSVRGTVPSSAAVWETLDAAHSHLVGSFTALTRPSMHEIWRRTA